MPGSLHVNEAGGYAYLRTALGFASAAVRAEAGYAIERGVFVDPPDIAGGLRSIGNHLASLGRPPQALCGLELRMPEVLSRSAFQDFNARYLAHLADYGVLVGGSSPLTRTNVVPRGRPTASVTLLAFSYTVPSDWGRPTFVLSGVPELPETYAYPDDIIRRGETDRAAVIDKARTIVDRLRTYTGSLGADWGPSASVHVYSLLTGLDAVRRDVLAPLGLAPAAGVVWHDAAPPVLELDIEIDVRSYRAEVAVSV